MLQKKVTQKIKTRNVRSADFIKKNRAFCGIMWKNYGRARQAIDGNIAHAHCMLENYGYTHTHAHTHTYTNTHTQTHTWNM